MRGLGDQGIRTWGLEDQEIGKRFSQSPSSQISKSRFPNILIALTNFDLRGGGAIPIPIRWAVSGNSRGKGGRRLRAKTSERNEC